MHESIELQMSLLLAVALAGHLLSGLVRQPAVVGQILAGLIVGPSILGWITYTTFVANIAHLGAIVLLFVVGLEFRARELAAVRPFVIAVAGIIVPWLAGYLLARGFGFETSRALLIGVALSATSIVITADTLRELGRLQSPEAKLIIGAAVIDNVLALLALSLSEQLGSGELELLVIALMFVKAVLFIGVGMAPRGEVAMVIALLALNRGIIEQPAYVALVLMSLVTTVVVPLLLRNWLYRS